MYSTHSFSRSFTFYKDVKSYDGYCFNMIAHDGSGVMMVVLVMMVLMLVTVVAIMIIAMWW